MLRVAGTIVLIAVYIYFIIDVLRTPSSLSRSLPRWAWLLVVVFLPIIGGVLWLAFGRVWPENGSRFGRRRRPAAPDDDPRFLKQLGDDAWAERMRRKREQDGGQETPA